MTHDTPIRLDHVGIAVHAVADAEPFLETLGCRKVLDEVVLDDTSVPYGEHGDDGRFRWASYRLGDASGLELIAPVAEDTFLTDFLAREGPGLHHLTFDVADCDAMVDLVESAGYDVVDHATFDDWTEAFVSPRNPTGALLQFIEHHDGYAEGRGPARDVFPTGRSLAAVDPPSADPGSDLDVGDVPRGQAERMATDPFCAALGIDLLSVDAGTARTALTVREDLLNFHGTPHGGAVYALADAAFAAASNSHGETAVALETNVSYLEAVDVGERLTATAEETHLTRRTAEYEVVVTDEADDRVATFRGRVYRFEGE